MVRALVCLAAALAAGTAVRDGTEVDPVAPPVPVLEAAIADMREVLSEIRGHRFKGEVALATMTGPQVRSFLLKKLEEEYPDERIAAGQKVYVHFGFLEPDDDLKSLFLQMLAEQAAGFYDPDEKRLLLVAEGSFPSIALVHELAHALQDQTFDVGRLIDGARENDDALLAVQAMIEGEATALSNIYRSMRPAGDRPLEEALGMRPPHAGLQAGLEKLAKIPEILQANLMFPYEQGAAWAGAVVQTGGQTMMDQMFRRPPESTEQILHPEKIQSPRDVPSTISRTLLEGLSRDLAAGGWREVRINSLGEFNIRELLDGLGERRAEAAAGGWDGDLYQVVERPGSGTAMIWITVWDSAGDAAEFGAGASLWLAGRHQGPGGHRIGSGGVPPRAIYVLEGFDPSLADLLEKSLQDRLLAGVTFR